MASGGAEPHLMYATYNFHCFIGRSINVKSAGLIGRHGPQSKQPFMVAFFKASEVLFRSVRAANNKRKNQNRNKSSSHQESSRMPSVGGKTKLLVSDLLVSLQQLWHLLKWSGVTAAYWLNCWKLFLLYFCLSPQLFLNHFCYVSREHDLACVSQFTCMYHGLLKVYFGKGCIRA